MECRLPMERGIICAYCGKAFDLPAHIARSRRKRNKYTKELCCSAECGTSYGSLTLRRANEVALASGVMKCAGCGKVRRLGEFRRKARPGHLFPYTHTCIDCTPTDRRKEYIPSARRDKGGKALCDVRLRDARVGDDEVISLANCDHTPVCGRSQRAPDWRTLRRADADDYKWSCRICGFSHKEYNDAKECCEPKGICVGSRFIPFEGVKHKAPAITGAENQGA